MGHTGAIYDSPAAVGSADSDDDFAAMFASHFPRVVRALELGGLDHASAEDVAEEAFARTLGHWRRVRKGSNPPGYVFMTAFRLSRRVLARQARTGPLPAGGRSASDPAAEAGSRLDLERALAAMPARRRACAVCCFVVGMSPKEAASALGIAEGTVRKQLASARDSLREALAAQG
jgi:RNA polymerase sigma factor (sigma-70 family)